MHEICFSIHLVGLIICPISHAWLHLSTANYIALQSPTIEYISNFLQELCCPIMFVTNEKIINLEMKKKQWGKTIFSDVLMLCCYYKLQFYFKLIVLPLKEDVFFAFKLLQNEKYAIDLDANRESTSTISQLKNASIAI